MSLRDRLMGRRPDPAAPAVGNGNGAGGLPGSDLGGATVAGGNGAGLYSPVGGAPLPPPPAAPVRGSSLYQGKNEAQEELSQIDTLKMELHRRLIEMLDL